MRLKTECAPKHWKHCLKLRPGHMDLNFCFFVFPFKSFFSLKIIRPDFSGFFNFLHKDSVWLHVFITTKLEAHLTHMFLVLLKQVKSCVAPAWLEQNSAATWLFVHMTKAVWSWYIFILFYMYNVKFFKTCMQAVENTDLVNSYECIMYK